MKVLNWVHRRFLNVTSCTAILPENDGVEKGVSSKLENEMHVLLEHNAHLVDMVDSWKDGILSIGTLAISPLEATKFGEIEEIDNDHDEVDIITNVYDHNIINDNIMEDVNEAIPLINVELFSHELEKVIGANHEIIEEEIIDNVVDLKDNNTCDDFTANGEIKKRVTLADLFLEDSDYQPAVKVLAKIENDDYNVDDHILKDDIITEKQGFEMMKQSTRAKHGLSKAKKVLKEDLLSLKKFNQLMKRMMKKKIHPDLEGKVHKDMEMHPSLGLSDPTNDQNAANNELASLLLIQDNMA